MLTVQCFCRLISSREAGVEFVGAAAPPACSSRGKCLPSAASGGKKQYKGQLRL